MEFNWVNRTEKSALNFKNEEKQDDDNIAQLVVFEHDMKFRCCFKRFMEKSGWFYFGKWLSTRVKQLF